MGRIEIEGMEFYAFHGCHKEERIIGGHFTVDIYIDTNIEKAAISDNLEDTINYQNVYYLVKEQMAYRSNIIENVAQRLYDKLIKTFPEIQKIKIKVSKLNPPVGGKIEKVSVVIEK
jgi:dihydroneopterin aldolase